MAAIREETAKFIEQNFELPTRITETLFDIGLIREDLAKRVLIRDEYYAQCKPGNKTDLKWELAEKYAVSTSTVEKILCKSG